MSESSETLSDTEITNIISEFDAPGELSAGYIYNKLNTLESTLRCLEQTPKFFTYPRNRTSLIKHLTKIYVDSPDGERIKLLGYIERLCTHNDEKIVMDHAYEYGNYDEPLLRILSNGVEFSYKFLRMLLATSMSVNDSGVLFFFNDYLRWKENIDLKQRVASSYHDLADALLYSIFIDPGDDYLLERQHLRTLIASLSD
jgi:hypothetical protein